MLEFFSDKKVLVTGGTGSLGKKLIKTLKSYNCKIIVYSRDEGKQALFFGQDDSITRVIGDVRDYRKLKTSMLLNKPDYVIHTAALKRVDDMEHHPDECVKTNIIGSENVARASLESGVDKCVLISTDKACMPVNVYGSSKFLAERIFTNYNHNSESTRFLSVRYGNVIASRGSFIPLWMSLIEEGKPINVTSLDCSRFLFRLDDAVNVVLRSIIYSLGGEVFVPLINSFMMGSIIEAVKQITGAKDVPTNITGMRPGEKIHEDMLSVTELPFSYSAPCGELIQIRPQYTKIKYQQDWTKYEGEELNSSLYINSDVDHLCSLIESGLE